MEFLNPCTDHDEILQAHPHLPKKGFGADLRSHPPGPGSLKL